MGLASLALSSPFANWTRATAHRRDAVRATRQQQAGRKWGGCVAAGLVSWLLDELSRRETAWSNRSGARLRGPPIADSSACPRLILALGQGAMPDSDQRPEVEAPEELLADMPLPSDAKTFFLGGIFVL